MAVCAVSGPSARIAAERRLFAHWHRTGDPAARHELIVRHLPLARSLARRFEASGVPFEDLVQVAGIGLIKAVDRFDPARGMAFSSFAVPTILGELKRHLRDATWAVHVPRGLLERALAVAHEADVLTAEGDGAPSIERLAETTGLPIQEVAEAREAAHAREVASLDEPRGRAGSNGGGAYADRVGREDDRYDLVERAAGIAGPLAALPHRERLVLWLRFAEDRTQSEIAERIGVSQMHVSRLIRESLRRVAREAGAHDVAPAPAPAADATPSL